MTASNAKNIEYKTNNDIPVKELTDLYNSVGWAAYADSPEIMEKILSGSFHYISAWSDGKLVGLIRTISDGCYILYIQDILVNPDYHRNGIGTELMKCILEQAKDMKQIILTTENTEKTKEFYRSVGFQQIEETGAISFTK